MAISPISIATDGFIVPAGTGGTGGNSRSFVGSSAGVGTASAVMQVPALIGLLGLSSATSSASATLKRIVGLIGSSDGITLVGATMNPIQLLRGAATGEASTTSELAVDYVLTGESSGQAQTIGHVTGGTGTSPALTLLSDPRHIDD